MEFIWCNQSPVTVTDDDQNIILWMDHRAQNETEFINQTKHPILNNAGGRVSVESMIPKILWIKNNRLECWNKSGYFFLLPDFLTWRATGEDKRQVTINQGTAKFIVTILFAKFSSKNYKRSRFLIKTTLDSCSATVI